MNEKKSEKLSLMNIFKDWMKKENVDIYLIVDYDLYLNSSVPLEKNLRFFLSGFKGSRGECLIFSSNEKSCLFVDGRYHLQAKEEVDLSEFEIFNVPEDSNNMLSIKKYISDYLNKKGSSTVILGSDSYRIGYLEYQLLFFEFIKSDRLIFKNIKYPEFLFKDLIQNSFLSPDLFSSIPLSISGLSTAIKLEIIKKKLRKNHGDFIWITRLDDLSYLCNLRYYGYPFSSIFNGFALIGFEENYLFLEHDLYLQLSQEKIKEYFPLFHVFSDERWLDIYQDLISRKKRNIFQLYDINAISFGRFNDLKQIKNIHLKKDTSKILLGLRSLKNRFEIKHIKQAYRKTDKVFDQMIIWINEEIEKRDLSEKDIDIKLEKLFKEESGKILSFQSIVATGKNSAFIHYSNANEKSFLKKGDLLLIDAGAYFEGGYATDLTRTYWIKNQNLEAQEIYKKIYTFVLKASIQVMSHSFKEFTKALVLDQIARDCLKVYGYNFKHSLGHGLGIFVHEYPPTISSKSLNILKESMIFTVEPGIYIEGLGGVRIENAVIVVKDKDKSGYLKLEPISFARLDNNLIHLDLLNIEEKKWLDYYQSKYSS